MFRMVHNCINVLELSRSLEFYHKAFSLKEDRRSEHDGFTLVFLGDGKSGHQLELTWIHDRKTPYDLGENERHLAFVTDDIKAAHAKHAEMGCICFENPGMGIYFVSDPDGYWCEVIPSSRD